MIEPTDEMRAVVHRWRSAKGALMVDLLTDLLAIVERDCARCPRVPICPRCESQISECTVCDSRLTCGDSGCAEHITGGSDG
jgi:hypothetical protein